MTYSEYLVLSLIYFYSDAMCKKHIVGNDIRLCCRITTCTVSKSSRTAPRCRNPNIEAQICEAKLFIYSGPILDTVPKSSKTFFSKKAEILPKRKKKWIIKMLNQVFGWFGSIAYYEWILHHSFAKESSILILESLW